MYLPICKSDKRWRFESTGDCSTDPLMNKCICFFIEKGKSLIEIRTSIGLDWSEPWETLLFIVKGGKVETSVILETDHQGNKLHQREQSEGGKLEEGQLSEND